MNIGVIGYGGMNVKTLLSKLINNESEETKMNVNTGELRRLLEGEEAPEGFEEVPDEHKELAEQLLGSNDSVFVPKSNPLRKEMKKLAKNKKKIANKSRAVNRRKKK